MNTQISVIIPVYNCVNYLQKCLDSILSQKNVSIEVILINDGSTDGSEKIATDYAKKDTRITLINQENRGAAAARQVGIDKSIGEYITFVDADDSLPINALHYLYANSEQCDMVVGHVCLCYPDGITKIVGSKPQLYDKISYTKALLLTDICVSPYSRITKRTLFDNNTSNIPSKIKIGEDLIMNIRLGVKVNKCKGIDKVVYNYNKEVENSITQSNKTELPALKKWVSEVIQPLIDSNLMDICKNEIVWLKAIQILKVLNSQYTIDTNDELVKETSNEVRHLKWSIKNSRIKLYFFLLRKSLLSKHTIKLLKFLQKSIHWWFRLFGHKQYTTSSV